MKKRKAKPHRKCVKAWADIGSYSGIFEFTAGPVAECYPALLHIHSRKVAPHLKPVTITYVVEP